MDDHLRASDADRDRIAALERWYRRLLALYPARYRRVHEEEMLAVLMTAAPDRRDRPRLVEAADLIVGAVRVWGQTLRGGVCGWRAALALISAGAALGLLAGIPFASVSPPLQTEMVGIRLSAAASPAAARAQQALVSSYPVLAQAARTMGGWVPANQPPISEQYLRSHTSVSLRPHGLMVITVQAPGPDAQLAARAVNESYATFAFRAGAGEKNLYMRYAAPGPASTDVLETAGLGALCGTAIGAIAGIGLGPRRRRLRMT